MPLPSTLAHPERDAWIRRELLERLYADDEPERLDPASPIFDALVLESLAAAASRPSLWRRAGEQVGRWFDSDAACVVVLLLALAALVALPVMAGHR